VFKKLSILAGLIVVCSLGWYLFYPREHAAGLSARPNRADAEAWLVGVRREELGGMRG